jgi:hypothetical protein
MKRKLLFKLIAYFTIVGIIMVHAYGRLDKFEIDCKENQQQIIEEEFRNFEAQLFSEN